MKTVLIAALLCALGAFASEDPKLRQEANELAQRSIAVSTPVQWPQHHAVIEFRYTDPLGTSTEGRVTIDRESAFIHRTEIVFGDFHSLHIQGPAAVGGSKNQSLAPPGVREIQKLSPVYTIRFDHEDIINEIRTSTVQGRPARCIYFTSNFGSKSKDGEVCYDRAAGMLLHFRFGGEVIDNSNWTEFGGAWLPRHVEKSEDGRPLLSMDQTFTLVDSFPPDTFTLTGDARPFKVCTEWRRPTGVHMPQPKAGPGENVDDIVVQGRIERDGSVTTVGILSSKRPDLEAEALKVASQWTFRPAACNGEPEPSNGDFTLHFKGR